MHFLKSITRKKVTVVLLAAALLVPAALNAQFGGVVFDPTNYNNALLRYAQLQQQLIQLKETYQQVLSQYNLAVRMATNLKNMPARYRAAFSQWRSFSSSDLYGNTSAWVGAVNGGGAQTVSPAYQQAIVPLLGYSQADLNVINSMDAQDIKSAYASLELMDGANVSALTTVGNMRANAQIVQQQIANLEQDSLSSDPTLNTEIGVLNKINASNVLTLQTMRDENNLRIAALEQQVLQAKQQRDVETANLNFAIQMREQASQNLIPFNNNLTQSLASYRLP
jgi:hypothetical protein